MPDRAVPWLRHWAAPLLAPTAVAIGLTLFDLTSRSIWLDEASTYAVASQHGATLWHLLTSAGGNFFFYYAFMHVVTSIFGTSLLVLRLPSALAAIATVPVAAILLTRLFDRRAAVCGTWFLVLSGPLTFWSQQARGYSIAVLFVTTAALGLVTAINGRRAGWWLFAAAALLAIYTVLLSGLVIAALAVSVVLRGRGAVPWRMWLVSMVAIGVGCLPECFLAIHRGFVVPLDWLGRPGTAYGPSTSYLLRFLLSAKTSGMPVTVASPVVLAAMLAAVALGVGRLAWRLRRDGRDPALWPDGLLVLWMVLPPVAAYVFSATADPVLVDRYILTSVPAASMFAGVVVARLEPRIWSGALAAVIAVALGWQLVPSYGVSLEDWHGAESLVARQAASGDCTVFFAADGYDAVDYYIETGSTTFPMSVVPAARYRSRTSYALDPAAFSRTELQHAATACSRLWVVQSHVATTRPNASAPAYERLSFVRYRTLMSQLAGDFAPATVTHFKAVTVKLYRRRP